MAINRNYGKVADGAITYAPKVLHIGGRVIGNPRPETYASAGWLPVVDTPPAEPAAEGKHWEARGWTTDGATNTRVYEQVDNPPVYRTYSKLKLYAALFSAGLWDSVKAWLEAQDVGGMNAYTAFSLAQDLTDSNKMFAAYLAQIKADLGVSDEVVEQILEASVIGY